MGDLCDRLHIMHVAILVIDVVDKSKYRRPPKLPHDLFDLRCCRISGNPVSGILGDLTNNTPGSFDGKEFGIMGQRSEEDRISFLT